jgi:hypothetical protein
MKRTIYCLLFLAVLFAGCASNQAVETPPPAESPAPAAQEEPAPAAQEVFNPETISKEVFDSTKVDVQRFIQDLNKIISNKNYQGWVANLGPKYLAEISDPAFLAKTSEQPRLKAQKIVLRTAEDYFIHVVVPSRANDQVDDIEFVGQHRVKAYRITPNKQRLRLYELESSGNTWKIIN